METLNELYDNLCKPGDQTYKKITDKITLIDNFFKNFDTARNFFIGREKWKCTPYQGNSKPGCEIVFPAWVGKSLMEKYIIDNKIIDDMNSYDILCNFFYNNDDHLWSISNSNYFPHFDGIEEDGVLRYICLINLNLFSVETKFYSFRNTECCDFKNLDNWKKYVKNITEEFHKCCDKKSITRENFKLFLDSKKQIDIKLIKTIKYNPNQAIVYPSNLFHCPNVTSEFTEENPRVLLRTSFYQEVKTNKLINYS